VRDRALRPATAADVEAVAELRAVVLRRDLERLGGYDEERVRAWLRAGFGASHTWVIEVDDAFAGFVALRPAAARPVLEWVIDRCIGSTIRRNVLTGSPARRRYERHGFRVESEDPVEVFMVRPAC
jgi:hypothetical protein